MRVSCVHNESLVFPLLPSNNHTEIFSGLQFGIETSSNGLPIPRLINPGRQTVLQIDTTCSGFFDGVFLLVEAKIKGVTQTYKGFLVENFLPPMFILR